MDSNNSNRPRARDIAISIGEMTTGPFNAITDVPGVRVGHVSLVYGEGRLQPGKGPVRTGVTAIIPHAGDLYSEKVCAAAHVINGFGKSVGLSQITELGCIETPILLTNTLNVWTVADALVDHMITSDPRIRTINPVVGECNDSFLNDIAGRHVKKEHGIEALARASSGPVEEGSVGAGVGMRGFSWKGGIGTASRVVSAENVRYTLGVLVLTNTGRARALRVDGVAVGKELIPPLHSDEPSRGSIMIIVGTDAPVDSRQLGRIIRRAAFGLARTGAEADHGSGDFVIGFSNALRMSPEGRMISFLPLVTETGLDLFFRAVIEATEEAIINSLLRATTVVGRDGNTVHAIPIDGVVRALKKGR